MILDDLASSIPDSFEIILLCEAMEDEDAPNFVGEGSNLQKVLIALILPRAIVCQYFCLLQNPSAITTKLALIALNDCFETGVVEDMVVFLAFRNGITKKVPNITVIDAMSNILVFFVLHSNEAQRMTNDEYC